MAQGSARGRLVAVGCAVTTIFFGAAAAAQAASYTITGQATAAEPAGETTATTTDVTYTVRRAPAVGDNPLSGGSVTVKVLSGTAGPADVAVTSTKVDFGGSALPATKDVVVKVNSDDLDEGDESFTVQLADATDGSIGSAGTVLTTITDNDDDPVVNLSTPAAQSVPEGDADKSVAVPVTLDKPSGRTVTVKYAVTLGDGAADTDATPATGTLTIAAGSTSATAPVTVRGDKVDEPAESVTVTFSEPQNAKLVSATNKLTITDDDAPTFAITAADVREGGAGVRTPVQLVVSLSNPSQRRIEVDYATVDGGALAGSDFEGQAGTLAFAPGETARAIDLVVLGDTAVEKTETFLVQLKSPTVGRLPDFPYGGVRIADDDLTVTSGSGPGVSGTGSGGISQGSGENPLLTAGSSGLTFKGDGPRMGVSTLKYAKGLLTVSLTCPAAEQVCRGTLAVFSVKDPGSKVKRLRSEMKLGTKVFVLSGGATAKLTLRLPAAKRALLKQGGKVKAKAYVVARDAGGAVATLQRTGTLKG